MPTIFGANTADPAYEISNSLRLNSADSAYLKKTVGDGDRRKWTLSMWLKKTKIINNTEMYMWSSDDTGSGNAHDGAGFYSFGSVTGDNTSNSFHHQLGDAHGRIVASANARDVSAWYHVVWNVDTANSTAGDRMKLFVNGSRITDVVTSNNNPDQNFDTEFNRNSTENYLFADHHYGRYYFDGYVADVAFVDGQAYDASYFGKTNNNGVWVPIEPNVSSWGTNGFFLEFKQTGTSANSSGIGADTSGNDNHWTPANLAATDVTTDTPTNNFCTLNPLAIGADATLSEGNCQIAYGSGTRSVSTANMGFANGKWYWEWKISAASTDGCSAMLGIGGLPFGPDLGTYLGTNSDGYSYNGEDGQKYSGGANSSYGNNFTTNDIISVAFDADNGNLYFYKNGTIQNSGTAAYTSLTSPSSGFYYPAIGDASPTKTFTAQANFGNPPHSIASGNSDANGYGNFEYAVPSGYYSLCTKNLAEFG